jgi:hypothetical protein
MIMSSEQEEFFLRAGEEEVPVEELVRRQGARPVESVDDMARPQVFDSDEEWEAFLDDLYASRHSGLA